ncbi:hypothetical protein [Microbulbifer sp. 2205BS26-8]|uniref:hypothetical protein n=1 Tax=Microbulbifer sp. 2205BS26-8 TaxID=3064386 RepID=UPI003530BD0F
MSKTMNNQDFEQQLQAHATELAKGIKSEADLNTLTQKLVKMTVEAALSAELEEHLGYSKHDSGNSRNGSFRFLLPTLLPDREIFCKLATCLVPT